MIAISPGFRRLVRFLVRRSTRATPLTPGRSGDLRRRSTGILTGRILPRLRGGFRDRSAARVRSRVLTPVRPAVRRRRQQLLGVRRAVAEPSSPASIRDNSCTRPSSSSMTTPLRVTRPSSLFTTLKCRSAKAATCGRWVTTSTWAERASRASRRPTSTAALPPTPASISSNTNVGTGSAPANTTSTASISRDSSPPEAPRCSGRNAVPGCAANSISTSSMPVCPKATLSPSTTRPAGSGRRLTVTTTRLCGIASAVSSAPTARPRSAPPLHARGAQPAGELTELSPQVGPLLL